MMVVLCLQGAMQTPEAGADSSSNVPLQTSVPAVSAQQVASQVPVQQQVSPCVSKNILGVPL